MSRPRCSVPSRCSALGCPSVYAAFVAIGSYDCKRSAKTAVSTITTMRTPPAAPSGFFRAKRASTGHAPGRARGSRATTISAGLTAIAHARVEDPVQHVHEEIRQDHDGRDEHDEILDDRVGAPQDRLDPEACHPRQVDHGLGDHEPADEEGELDADDRSEEHTSELQSRPHL